MKKVLVLISAFALVACGGGGNGDGSGGLSHNELATQFVNALNASGEYDVSLAKSSTLRNNYIVIYDYDLDEYTAVNIGNYSVGQDPVQFMESNSTSIFFDLDILPAHWEYEQYSRYDSWCECYVSDVRDVYIPTRYRDRYTGYVFEKITGGSKDLEKFAALAEEKIVSDRAADVSTRFGLSVDRSKEVVRLSMAWKKAGGKDLTAKDQDAFSKEALGFSITEAKSAVKRSLTGETEALDDLIETAAATNRTTPENVRQIVNEYFGQ